MQLLQNTMKSYVASHEKLWSYVKDGLAPMEVIQRTAVSSNTKNFSQWNSPS